MIGSWVNPENSPSGCWRFGHITTDSGTGDANIHQLSFRGANNGRVTGNPRRSPSSNCEGKKDAHLQTCAWRELRIPFEEDTGSTDIYGASLVPNSFVADAITNRYSQIESDGLRFICRFTHAPSSPFPLSNGSRD